MTKKLLRIDGIQIGAVPLTANGNAIVTGGPIDLSNSTISWTSITSKPTFYGNADVAEYLANFDGTINFTASPATINAGEITAANISSTNGFFWNNGVSILDGISGVVSGNISVSNSAINFVANSSGDGNGYSTIHLIPDTTTTSDQLIIIDPTAPGHIHIRAGGTQDSSSAQLFLGGENSHFMVSSGMDPQLYIRANNNDWVFGTDGNLNLPVNGVINYANGSPFIGAVGFTGSQGVIGFTGSQGTQGNVGFTGSQGIQGTTGFTGSQGDQGITGFTGSQGTQGNVGFTGSVGPVAGSANQIVYKDGSNNPAGSSNFTFASNIVSVPQMTILAGVGDEGGELLLTKPTANATYSGTGITIDAYRDKLRIFEQGGDARGAFIDITTLGSGVSTHLVHYKAAAPTTNKGASGDLKGHYAISGSDLYVCNTDYTNGTANIWVKITGTSSW